MSLFVDTSVWSLVFRRDRPSDSPEADRLRQAIAGLEALYSTPIVLQEVLQGFRGAKARSAILQGFRTLTLLTPTVQDHIEAAELRITCRSRGVQVGTVDALLAQLCIGRGLVMLSADRDFRYAARHVPLRVWES